MGALRVSAAVCLAAVCATCMARRVDAEALRCAELPRPSTPVRLTVSTGGPVTNASPTIRAIVDSVWRPYGVTFQWAPDDSAPSWDGIRVWVAAIYGVPFSDAGAVGQVQFHAGTPRPLIRLSMDAAIAWVLREEMSRFQAPMVLHTLTLGDAATLVPQALGYAAAHELGHWVLASQAHSSTGIMQPVYTRPQTFVSSPDAVRLDAANTRRLNERLAASANCGDWISTSPR